MTKEKDIMDYRFAHTNINVMDLDKSIKFYKDALGLVENRRINAKDDSFTIVFLGDSNTSHALELTYLADRTEPYDLDDNEIHIAFIVDDYDTSLAHHKEMGCVCFENTEMGIYFIEDPDGYWMEVIPTRK
ncbi:VOC family protein [Desulfobacterales bacterium HSG17]|nr:VOC family protein [Desulfobacterales bacterium HSG17]